MKKSHLLVMAALCSANAFAADIISQIGIEGRYFNQDALYPEQLDNQVSVKGEVEFYWEVGENGNSFLFTPYFRADSEDSERHLLDIKELVYMHVGDDWELRAGITKVFWGVTETVHLVDIINQTDTLASFDGEEKLGQPMLNVNFIRDWGVIEAYLLLGFREADFAGQEGRLRAPLKVMKQAAYESSEEDRHIDYAFRWSNSIGNWDLGLSWFAGTARQAELIPVFQAQRAPQLQAFYPQIQQASFDGQYIYNDWLFKLEAINRSGDLILDYSAAVTGFEYTLVGLWDSNMDLGLVVEHAYDDRKDGLLNANQNDLALATRWVVNDAESTEMLVGFRQDLDFGDTNSFFIEANTRVGESTKVTLDAWFFNSKDADEISYNIRRDDFIQLDITHYF